MGKSGTAGLLLHIVHYWCACAVDKDNCDLAIDLVQPNTSNFSTLALI